MSEDKLVKIERSKRPKKKWDAIFKNERTGRTRRVSFGARGMDDYTLTGDKDARERYRKRHAKDLRTNDPTKPGFLSLTILWNKPTMSGGIKDYRRRFNIYRKTGKFPTDGLV